jgi:N-carbamoyl-L-amino-acid hydrolase
MHIQLKRLQDDLQELFQIGHNSETQGVDRLGFSDMDMKSKEWLKEKIRSEGFYARMDGATNIIAHMHERVEGPVVAIGSHIDSVPSGGMFDGTLGVLAGLECMRVFRENNISTKYPIELISFAEEEGRFGGMLGSEAMVGRITPGFLDTVHDVDGVFLKDEFTRHGLDIYNVLKAHREPKDFRAFLELHIEQGPILEAKNKPIGIVEGISGVFKWMVTLKGKAAHAGTTPLEMRADAFRGLADFTHEIPRIIDEEGSESSRLTIGKVELKPGNPHTVPGEVNFSLVGRDMNGEQMHELACSCRRVLSAIGRRHDLLFEFEEFSWLDPKPCSSAMIDVIKKQSKQLGYDYELMPSGAGHDTQFMADITEVGLIFVPSVGGVSHSPEEWTHWTDVEKGSNLLLQSALAVSQK